MPDRKKWNERYATRELVWSRGPNARFASEVVDLTPGMALDVACGEGRNGIWLAEQGWRVTAIDFSDVAIRKASQIARRRGVNVQWIIGDVASYPLSARAFDLVAVLYLHTGAAERAQWLRNVIGAVKPSGTFVYIGHDPSNIEQGVGGPQDPDLLPDIEEMRAALVGFRLQVARVVERPVDGEPGHGQQLTGVARDTVIRAVRTGD